MSARNFKCDSSYFHSSLESQVELTANVRCTENSTNMSSTQSNSKLTKNRKRLAKFRGEDFKTDAKLVAELGIKNRALKEEIAALTASNDTNRLKTRNEQLQKTCDEQQTAIKQLESENDTLLSENVELWTKDGNVPPKKSKVNDDRDLRKENNRLRQERNDFRDSAESWEGYYDAKSRELEKTKKDLEVSEKKNKSVIGTMMSATKTREIYEYHYLRMSENIYKLLDVVEQGRTDLLANTDLKIYSRASAESTKTLNAEMYARRTAIVKKHTNLYKKQNTDANVSTSSSSSK